MEIKRKVTFNGVEGTYDAARFTVGNNDNLSIAFELPTVKYERYHIIVTRGTKNQRFTATTSPAISLSSEWLNETVGNPVIIRIELRDWTGGIVYKTYNVEPLIEEAINGGSVYFGAVQDLYKQVENLTQGLIKANEEIFNLKNYVAGVPDMIDQAKKELNGVTLESLVVAVRVARAVKLNIQKGILNKEDFPLLLHIDEILSSKMPVNIPWEAFTYVEEK